MATELRVGTRGSALALAQAQQAVAALLRVAPDQQWTIVPIVTTGDRDRATSLTVLGGSGVFVKELHEALLAGGIDLAVHSAKDLPTQLPRGLELVAVLGREDVRDVVVSRSGATLATLPPGARIGTSSRRRRALVAALRPDVELADVRGNVDTRLRKLWDGAFDALILAAAGLARLGRLDVVTEYLGSDIFVPAPGQGALALVCRVDDPVGAIVAQVDEPDLHLAVAVERSFLAAFGSGCSLPLGAYATVAHGMVTLRVAVAGSERGPLLRRQVSWPTSDAIRAAAELAREIQAELAGRGSWQPERSAPLAGRRVLVLRPLGQERDLVERLRALQAVPVVAPAIRIVPPDDWEPLDRALAELERFDWVVFTSVNGVRVVIDRLGMLGRFVDVLRAVKVAAIGPGTARELAAHGVTPSLVPRNYVAEAVAKELIAQGVGNARILLPRAAEARDVLPRALAEAGANVVVVPAYRTQSLPLPENVRHDLIDGRIDWVLLTSSSTVRSLVAAVGDFANVPSQVRVAAIGPVTAATARELQVRVDVVAERHTIDGLIEAIVRAEGSSR
ncbi:hydroxymethylbilane synthase [Thermomicrobium sp. CFH 73360]|uniref:hydroxymethylbilane synthase n=1 Tax=Thermomicrobium sp. CFH 73360 TaxID=2951987 RepID=UPI002076B5C0|nr:hydroxymethylbilane synthase [Thermomicrobium sp. CFH 73360]